MRSVESTYKREHLAEKRGREHLALTTQIYIRIYTRKHLAEKKQSESVSLKKNNARASRHNGSPETRNTVTHFRNCVFLGFALS